MKSRDIGQEILSGIEEIKAWQKGEKKLKVIRLVLPTAGDVAKIQHNLGLSQHAFAAFMGVSVLLCAIGNKVGVNRMVLQKVCY